MFEFCFLKTRINAIEKSSIISKANPFSGQASDGNYYSIRQITKAKKNIEMNQKWFIRNHRKIILKFGNKFFYELGRKLGFSSDDLSHLLIRI